MALKNYYDLLGIQSTASPEDIKKAYRKLSLKFHPDKNDGDDFLMGMFKSINEANEIISNPDKRRAYDAKLKDAQEVKTNYDFTAKSEPAQSEEYDFLPGTTVEDVDELYKLWKQYEAKKKVADLAYDKVVYAQTVDAPTHVTVKKVLASLSVLLLVWLFFQPSASYSVSNPTRTANEWVTTETTKVYKKPNIKSAVIGELPTGTKVEALDETTYFLRVDFTNSKGNPGKGYVRKSSLNQK